MIARAENIEPDDEEPENTGGLGGPESIHPVGARDTRLIARAIRERWPVAEKWRLPLLERQARISLDPNSSASESTRAFRAILQADAMNQADEHKYQPDVHVHVGGQNAETTRILAASLLDRIAAGGSIEGILGEVIDEPTG